MSDKPYLDLSKLEKVKHFGGKITARCPACAASGGDNTGNHLVIFEDGKFGCIAFEGDPSHRKEIFALVGVKVGRTSHLSPTSKRALRGRKRLNPHELLNRAAAEKRDRILLAYQTPDWRADFFHASVIEVESKLEQQALQVLRFLFPEDAIVWTEGIFQSGKRKYSKRWRTAKEWIADPGTIGERFCAAHFQTGSFSRNHENVIEAPYIVVEADELIGKKPATDSEREENRILSASLIQFLIFECGLTLRAMIETGGKSIHSYFERPEHGELEKLQAIAEDLGIDPRQIDRPNSPLRLPGCIHEITGRQAALWFLNPKPSLL